jgi:2-polyprenyl-6-methoxyphenol hydroxylase-like FAD-dependent oxidoreductase
MTAITADVCVVGGGPAGLTLALELARAGVEVVVVEQSGSFQRSFRGESISPDAVLVLDRLGVLDRIHAEGCLVTKRMEIAEAGRVVLAAEFADYKYPHRFPMELPQSVLLNILAEQAAEHSNFTLVRRCAAVELVAADGAVTGVRVSGRGGDHDIRARLVVGADGRYSKVLDMSGLPFRRLPLDRDVMWLKLPLPPDWDTETYRVRIRGDRHGLFIPTYPDMVRVGFNIPKGGLKELRARGIGELHRRIDDLAPELSDLLRAHVTGWSDTTVLDIFTSVVPNWARPGLVLIGDAAHTLSPILGQGVNHALIDAVTLAPLVTDALRTTGPDAAVAAELTAATGTFQLTREADVRRSRALQLRQERMFTFASPPAVLLRSSLYRLLNSSMALRQRVLADAYFRLQKREAA